MEGGRDAEGELSGIWKMTDREVEEEEEEEDKASDREIFRF